MLPVYVTRQEYEAARGEWSASADKSLYQASRHIDSLTFNRIVAKGFDNLTPFQKEIIKEATLLQADFETENEDLINSVVSSYAINGVSVGLTQSDSNASVVNGVVTLRSIHSLLSQSGLCCRKI